jgi:hypothetical protein
MVKLFGLWLAVLAVDRFIFRYIIFSFFCFSPSFSIRSFVVGGGD